MRIKKLFLNTILIIIVLASLTTVSIADKNSIIKQLNNLIENKYGFKDYFSEKFGNVGEFNEEVFNKYKIPVYGNPHGDVVIIDGMRISRFIGYADTGESVPNPDYPPDSVTGQRRVDLSWIEDPWDDPRVYNHRNFTGISNSKFDPYREDFLDAFLLSFEKLYGENGSIYKNIFDRHTESDYGWDKYYHVVIPPTDISKGMVVMFHYQESAKKLWYQPVIVESLSALKDTLHIKCVTESGMLIEEKTVELLNDSTTAHTRLKSNPNSAISMEFTSRERCAFTTCCYFNLTIMQVAL